ncbi:hypothetical protein LTR62_004615 [Meristemomyces frigidus]|uniref:SET domain-containing protein n=1 Tax=Meristemomyces frigidus TaxID=1508187 RepID=A0AAN7THE8_9PEZI|nr:hypothetical protein LTR62_004615 [Meristemomyces frigidus]
MAEDAVPMTRSTSSNSSIHSNIDVHLAAEALLDSSSVASPDRLSRSTDPTSLAESIISCSQQQLSGAGAEEEEAGVGRRSKRARCGGVSTYNLKLLSDAQLPGPASSSRNVSGLTGRTLVNAEEEDELTDMKGEKGLEMDWELDVGPSARLKRKTSVKERVKRVAGKVGSVLGKRGRSVLEAGKRRLGGKKGKVDEEAAEVDEAAEEDEDEEDVPRWKKELDTGRKGLLDELDLDAEVDLPPPAKKARLATQAVLREMAQPSAALPSAVKASAPSKKMKRWQKEGLYVGQRADFDGSQIGGYKKLQKRKTKEAVNEGAEQVVTENQPPFMTLPMFAYLDKTRDFTIPYDIFAPSLKKGDEKPKDWHQVNRNRLIGEAKEMWEKSERLPASMCVCPAPGPGELGCDDVCLNRVMQYECNNENCNLSAEFCGNRAFAELVTRKEKGGPYDVGVEVLKTPNRGFGVRSCRTWAAGQIIMEYTGEIVSEGECQRRMHEDYKDKQCYYLMELERGLIIDGTKGSMARFINHSCEPNCEVRMVKVNGTPRMGVFAGAAGIMTGEELTYDYNFDNFGETQQECYCGAAACRGSLSKRLNATEQKKLLKVENERKRKAAEEAQKHAEDEDRIKRVNCGRGSGWRGWVAVDDPETKERLRREKREREKKEESSGRARRLAARRESLPVPAVRRSGDGARGRGGEGGRRKTVHVERAAELQAERQNEVEIAEPAFQGDGAARHSPDSSKRTEDLDLSAGVDSPALTHKTEPSLTKGEIEIGTNTTTQFQVPPTEEAEAGADQVEEKEHGAEEDQEAEDLSNPINRTPPAEYKLNKPSSNPNAEARTTTAKTKSYPLKNAVNTVSQAVKNTLLGAKSKGKTAAGEVLEKAVNGGKSAERGMKQTTLGFAKC